MEVNEPPYDPALNNSETISTSQRAGEIGQGNQSTAIHQAAADGQLVVGMIALVEFHHGCAIQCIGARPHWQQ